MIKEKYTNIERIIAKIDNDFNPDNSDWIPRVGAWCIDAMHQLNIFCTERKKINLKVNERIAYTPCSIANTNIKVYDKYGCEIENAENTKSCCGCSSTGDLTENIHKEFTPDTIDIIENNNAANAPDYLLAETLNSKEWPGKYRINEYNYLNKQDKCTHNFVLIDCNKIELNFDTDCITVEYDTIKTEISQIYGCELPLIPNNGLLIEAIGYYCLYKMLCRGYKHPVFNLGASQYGTNPYFIWNKLKDEAKRATIIDNQKDIDSNIWRNSFFNFTFNPKD